MRLIPLDDPELIELAAGWLAEPENHKWLDFGDGRQLVTPPLLKIMLQRDTHFLRIYLNDEDHPIGIVGLNRVNHEFRTATFWGVTGDKTFRNRGYATYAASRFLTIAFRELELRVINTWAVEHNPSRRIIERLNFRYAGRFRACHHMDGGVYDRIFYDLLASEHCELRRVRDARRGFAAHTRRPETAG